MLRLLLGRFWATLFPEPDAPLSAKIKRGDREEREDPMSKGFRITVKTTVSGITITIEPW